jgi:hypothetical protein
MDDAALRRARLGTWASAGLTAIAIFGAAATTSLPRRLGFCVLAAAAAGVCGGLVNRRSLLRGGHRALLRTLGLLGALTYLALLPALAYGERTMAALTGGDPTWRHAFLATIVLVLVGAFAVASRVPRHDVRRA